MSNPFLDMALSIQNIKKVEMIMPITRQVGTLTPLLVGDDLALKSTIASPQSYDYEICQLIYKHLQTINDGEQNQQIPPLQQFMQRLSNIDKICLLFGLYKVTYETLGKRKINCSSCKKEYYTEINADDLVHDDTFTMWEEDQPFTEYVYEISVPYGDYMYVFGTKLPTMSEHNTILNYVTPDAVQSNIEKIGNLFATHEQMALLTKYIKIGHKDSQISEYVKTDNMQEILITFKSAIPKAIQSEFFRKYHDKFGKYQPKFYKIAACPECMKEQQRMVNIELEFFRRSVLDEGSGGEVEKAV